MTQYRRNRVSSGTCCITVNLLDRRSHLLVDQVDTLRGAVNRVRQERPFHIDGWGVLPEHMHCMLTLPEEESDYSTRLRLIKAIFSRTLPPAEARSTSRAKRHQRGIWQRRFWEHTIRDNANYAMHMDYIHFNPVKHGLVMHPADWPFPPFAIVSHWACIRPIGQRQRQIGLKLETAGRHDFHDQFDALRCANASYSGWKPSPDCAMNP